MPDATDKAAPLFATPESIYRAEQIERLLAMTADDAAQKWDFSDRDIMAIEWALAEINHLTSENAKLKRNKGDG